VEKSLVGFREKGFLDYAPLEMIFSQLGFEFDDAVGGCWFIQLLAIRLMAEIDKTIPKWPIE